MSEILTFKEGMHPQFSLIPDELYDRVIYKLPKFQRPNDAINHFRDLCRTDMDAPYWHKNEKSGTEELDWNRQPDNTNFREDPKKRKRIEVIHFILGWPDGELGLTRAFFFDVAMDIYSRQREFLKWGFNSWEKNRITNDDQKWFADKGKTLSEEYFVSPDQLNVYPEKFHPLVGVAASVPMDTNKLDHYDPLKIWVGFPCASDVDEGRPMRILGFYMGSPKTKEPYLPFVAERRLPDGDWKSDHEFYCDPHTVRIATKAETNYLLGVSDDPWLSESNFQEYVKWRDNAVHNDQLFQQGDEDYWADNPKTYARLMAESCAPNPFEVGRCRQIPLPGSPIPMLKKSQYATDK